MKRLFGARPAGEADAAPSARLHVELALQADGRLFLAGWCNCDAELVLQQRGEVLAAVQRFAVDRPDVDAAGVGRPASGKPAGFSLCVRQPSQAGGLQLVWQSLEGAGEGRVDLQPEPFSDALRPRLGVLGQAIAPLLAGLIDGLPPEESLALLAGLPASPLPPDGIRGSIECLHCDLVGGGAMAAGWLHAPQGALVWLESEDGQVASLKDAVRARRNDVNERLPELPGGGLGDEPLFVLGLSGVAPGSLWRLKALSPRGVHVLGEVRATGLPDRPLDALRLLCRTETPMAGYAQRVARVEARVLQPLIDRIAAEWQTLTVQVRDLGPQPAAPQLSLVIPQYGRMDFIEPQLLRLAADPWVRAHVELVHVLDDPALLERLQAEAADIADRVGLGFRLVWGGANRGFSGANNLGAQQARAPVLGFVNSDVFPIEPGWCQHLVGLLQQHPDMGAVAPRLLHADGSLQHAGMAFSHLDSLGIWSNQHPFKGLQPVLDPARGLSEVPAVTGACLFMRRVDLDAVGGWDTGYLAGDFEDSDLCLKLRERGLRIAYEPAIALVHLERQSFRGLGDGGFRTRLVIYNAVRHGLRWGPALAAAAHAVPRAWTGEGAAHV